MTRNTTSHIPVLIIGAGPVGLTMAHELTRHGIPCRIVDQLERPITSSNALGVHARTLEAWDDMGILEDALTAGHPIHAMNLYNNHKKLLQLTLGNMPSRHPFVLALPQSQTETLLTDRLRAQGINVERPLKLRSLDQDPTHATLSFTDVNNKDHVVTCDWVIACDGGHSTVRQLLNIPFEGGELSEHFVMADLHVQSDLSKEEGHAFFSEQGLLLYLPLTSHGFGRLIAEVSQDSTLAIEKNPTIKDFERLVSERSPLPMTLSDAQWTSGFWIHHRMTPHYRYERIFLAGDAAHIHSPIGGQGMNTGIQDAYNLAWKLALVIKEKTTKALLASYETERYAIAKNVLKETTSLTQLVSEKSRWKQMLRNTTLSLLEHSSAFKEKLVKGLSETDVNYRTSPIVAETVGKNASRAFKKGPKPGDHALDGTILTLHGTTQPLSSITRGAQHALLVFTGYKTTLSNVEKKALVALQQWMHANYPHDVNTHIIYCDKKLTLDHNAFSSILYDDAAALHKRYGATAPCLYLLRPDKYIGFRAQPATLEAVQTYLSTLFNA